MIRRSARRSATNRELYTIILLAALWHRKKKGHGGPHGPPAPPPPDIPPPGGGGGGDPTALNMSSVGKYNPQGHPYTDRVPASAFPTSYLHTQYGFDTAGASIGAFAPDVVMTNSGNRATNQALLQSAIDTNCVLNQNTRILIPNDFDFFTPSLREITNAGKWIYIQRSTDPVAEGIRTNPSIDHPKCMVAALGEPALVCNRKASRYYIMGIEFEANPAHSLNFHLVLVSPRDTFSGTDFDDDIANVNEEIILDRCVVTGGDTGTGPFSANCRNGVTLNGKKCALINCYVHQISAIGSESHALLMTNSPGPSKVVNNFFECASIGWLIGGDVPHYGVVEGRPRDIEFRRNYHTKRLSWAPTDASWDGITGRNGKGLGETKNVLRMLCEGNVFDGCWADGQAGMIVVFKSGLGISVSAAGEGTEDLTFRYNIMRNSVRPWNFQGLDDETAEFMKRISAYDNLLYNMGTFVNQTSNVCLYTHRVDDLYIRHNTIISNTDQGFINIDIPFNPRSQRFTYSDNIHDPGGTSGCFMSGGFFGSNAIDRWAENPFWERNILVGLEEITRVQHPQGTNLFAETINDLNFVNAAANNYRLTSASPGWQAGVGGKNLGADLDKVDLATSGVV